MGVNLPPGPGVVLFGLLHRLIGIRFRGICGEFTEQQNILRATNAHLGAVFALLRPPQPIGLVVLPHHIRQNANPAHILKPMPDIVQHTHIRKRVHRGHAGAGGIAEQNPVFYMNTGQPPRLENPQKLRAEVVQLLEESVVVFIVAEVVIARRVFIVVGKRDRGHNEVNAVVLHLSSFLYAVVVDCREVLASDFHSFYSYASRHTLDGVSLV